MQLNQATDYAFRVVLHLASLPPGTVVNGQTMASTENIPHHFLLKIMRFLTAARLVRSFRGVEGGFSLGRPAGEITLRMVIEAVEGPVAIHRCLKDRRACTSTCNQDCPVHAALREVQGKLVHELDQVRFDDLASQRLKQSKQKIQVS